MGAPFGSHGRQRVQPWIGIELLAAAQGIDFQGPPNPRQPRAGSRPHSRRCAVLMRLIGLCAGYPGRTALGQIRTLRFTSETDLAVEGRQLISSCRRQPEPLFEHVAGDGPLLISFPHSGTYVPPGLAARLRPEALDLPDTDWVVAPQLS